MVANFLFASSITAIQGNAEAFNTISQNIANATTPGHKEEATRFRDLLVDSERAPGNIFPALRGTSTHLRRNVRQEGTIEASQNNLHLALSGRGFFVVNEQLDGSGETLLTDSGQLQRRIINNAGTEEVYLTDNAGNFVQGFPFDVATGTFAVSNTVSGLQPVRLDVGTQAFQASATTTASISANLNPDEATGNFFEVGLTIFDGTGAADGLGDRRTLNARFTKTANNNQWTLDFVGNDATVTSPAAATLVTFGPDGVITAPTNFSLDVTWANPAATTSTAVDMRDLRSFAPQNVLVETRTDGFDEGQLSSTTINDTGEIIGIFTNGQTRPLAKIAVGDVVNPELLAPRSDTHFALSGLSGPLQIFEADISGRARFVPNALEGSNVDLGEEMVAIIQTQRAYSSATTTLRTIEEMLETVLNRSEALIRVPRRSSRCATGSAASSIISCACSRPCQRSIRSRPARWTGVPPRACSSKAPSS